MAVIRTYDKQGNVLASGTSPADNGSLAWLGGNKFAVATTARATVITWDGKTGGQDRTIGTYGGEAVVGVGCDVQKLLNEWGELEPAGHALVITFKYTAAGIDFYVMIAYDVTQTGKLLFSYNFGASGSHGGVAHDGNNWYFSWQNTTPSTRLLRARIDGPNLTIMRNFTTIPLITDMCFDGRYLWAIESGVVYQYLISGRNVPLKVNGSGWTPTGSTPLGITTNGHNLFISTRT